MNQRHAEWRRLREQGLTFQAIADTAGVSQQAVAAALGKMPRPVRHGTAYRYGTGCHCAACEAYHRAHPSQQPPDHGTPNRYQHLGCRCPPCTAANTEKCRAYRRRRRTRQGS